MQNKPFIITLLLISFSIKVLSQQEADVDFKSIFPYTDKIVEYTSVLELDSFNKKEITIKIKEWALSNFNSYKYSIQTEDQELGFMAFKGSYFQKYNVPKGWGFNLLGTQLYTITYEIEFNMNFYIKDNKTKIVITNIKNKAIRGYGVWADGLNSVIAERPLNAPSVAIENAGEEALSEYQKNKKDKKYTIRLNYTANMWREIDHSMRKILLNIAKELKSNKKSNFDF